MMVFSSKKLISKTAPATSEVTSAVFYYPFIREQTFYTGKISLGQAITSIGITNDYPMQPLC